VQDTPSEIKSRRLAVTSLAYSPDSKFLATGETSTEVELWDAATGELIQTYAGHSDTVRSVSFSPDGKKLASGSADGTVMLWDVE
jgi:WD40 repeat protein